MILFLTQYYRGLGHAMRIKHILEETTNYQKCIIVHHLFKPPISYDNAYKEYTLIDKKEINQEEKNPFKALMPNNLIRLRIIRWRKILEENPEIKVIVSEGFPFCRHQWAYELFKFFDEAKKKNIKIVGSVRDFPWDEPHQRSLQDWVAKTQNLVVNHYLDKMLVHGDPKCLKLLPDVINHYQYEDIFSEISSKLEYTGYVANPKQKKHERKNNKVYVSCGLNKEESLRVFASILKISHKFPSLEFVFIAANEKFAEKLGNFRKKHNTVLVNYIPDLFKHVENCTMFITYGGYNSTMEILASQTPAIIIPREDGKKLEQLVRCFTLKPYKFFEVCPLGSLYRINNHIENILNDYDTFPKPFNFNINGTQNSAKILSELANA